MTENTSKWLRKAEADFRSMKLEYSGSTDPNYDAVCFFAQQCIEKWLKGLLIETNVPFSKTHDLQRLLLLLLPLFPEFQVLKSDLTTLTDLTTDVRYPYEFATEQEADKSIEICSRVREILKAALGEPPLFSKS